MSDWLGHFLGALQRARVACDAEDVADAIWLFRWMGDGATDWHAARPEPVGEAHPSPETTPTITPSVAPPQPKAPDTPAPVAAAGKGRAAQASVHLPQRRASGTGPGGRPFQSPGAAALPGALALARALRPLMRRVPSRRRWVLDEAETVLRAAEEGVWVPALRPARDRWLDLHLVVDTGLSLGVWRQTVQELRQLLEYLGAFRTVRAWGLDTEANPPRLTAGLRPPEAGDHGRDALELVDAGGRSLVLVLTDCVSPAWHGGGVFPLLETWGRHGPAALVQLLPEHLWSRTALRAAAPVQLTAPSAAVPNARLHAESPHAWLGEELPSHCPLPILTLEPQAVAPWARFLAGSPGRIPGVVPEAEPAAHLALHAETEPTPQTLVQRFWDTASPLAHRFAGLLAASPTLNLPVIRLIRQALLPAARQVHEAEVLLSGLLRLLPGGDLGNPDEVPYDFQEGVRALLLDAVPTANTLRVLEQVSSYVEQHLTEGRSFRALLADPAAGAGTLAPDGSPFAQVAAEVLLRLGGDYARLVRQLPIQDQDPGDRDILPFPKPAAGGRGESLQSRLRRVAAPRVHIQFDIQAAGAMEQKELPFVVGVLAPLSGHAPDDQPPLVERKFVTIDRDNFNTVLRSIAPQLRLRVPNLLDQDGSQFNVQLQFTELNDFTPGQVVKQFPPLMELWSIRRQAAEDVGHHSESTLDILARRKIREYDGQLSTQLRAILHHHDFQKLEATWRGLYYLVTQTETSASLKIRVLDVSMRDLVWDFEKAVEFDQSALFKKVYEEEFGDLGGEPYGLLVGDFEFGHSPKEVNLLQTLAGIAAAAHAPLVATAAPQMFNLTSFTDLGAPRDLSKIFSSVDCAHWNAFRDTYDSRFIALALPRVLARLPYGSSGMPVEEFAFEELGEEKRHDDYLWMSAAWAYAARVTDAFAKHAWLMRTRGVEGGGKVEGLPVHTFPATDGGVAMKCPTEIAVTDRREYELSNLGFLPLVHFRNTDSAAFIGNQTCHKPRKYDDPEISTRSEMSAKLNFLMCLCRFAHYVMAIARDRVGAHLEREDWERLLNNWLNQYVTPNPQDAGDELRARLPLRAARAEVREVRGKPGRLQAVLWLHPHFQMEGMDLMAAPLSVELPVVKQR